MAITSGALAVSSGTAVPLVRVPPGAFTLTMYASGTVATGAGTAVGTADSYVLTSSPITVGGIPSATGAAMYAAGTGTVFWIMATQA